MNKCFYLKMAVGNLRRNKEIYFPYLLASGLMIMVFYTFMLIAGNPGMENIPQSFSTNTSTCFCEFCWIIYFEPGQIEFSL